MVKEKPTLIAEASTAIGSFHLSPSSVFYCRGGTITNAKEIDTQQPFIRSVSSQGWLCDSPKGAWDSNKGLRDSKYAHMMGGFFFLVCPVVRSLKGLFLKRKWEEMFWCSDSIHCFWYNNFLEIQLLDAWTKFKETLPFDLYDNHKLYRTIISSSFNLLFFIFLLPPFPIINFSINRIINAIHKLYCHFHFILSRYIFHW